MYSFSNHFDCTSVSHKILSKDEDLGDVISSVYHIDGVAINPSLSLHLCYHYLSSRLPALCIQMTAKPL